MKKKWENKKKDKHKKKNLAFTKQKILIQRAKEPKKIFLLFTKKEKRKSN
jgi:uncharacterized protein YukJ